MTVICQHASYDTRQTFPSTFVLHTSSFSHQALRSSYRPRRRRHERVAVRHRRAHGLQPAHDRAVRDAQPAALGKRVVEQPVQVDDRLQERQVEEEEEQSVQALGVTGLRFENVHHALVHPNDCVALDQACLPQEQFVGAQVLFVAIQVTYTILVA